MWRIWLMIDARRALIGTAVFLFTLAIVIHFIVLSTDRFNWIEGPRSSAIEQTQSQYLASHTVKAERTELA